MRRLVLPLSLALLSACSKQQSAPEAAGGGGAPLPMPVQLLQVQAQAVPVLLEAVGQLEGLREVEVRARVGGILEQQLFQEGQSVAAGTPLYQIERARHELAVQAAQAALLQAEAQTERAGSEQLRTARLLADGMVSASAGELAASSLKAAQGQLAAARVGLREAQLNLGYTRVSAPIAGRVQRSLKSLGSLVGPEGEAALLTQIVQTHPMRVRFALSEAELRQLGASPQLQLLDANGQPLPVQAKLDFAGSTVDPRLGTVPMRAELPNADGRLLPGQTVRVQLKLGEQPGFLLPQAAVLNGEQGRFVWLMREGKATPQPVQTGGWQGDQWVIRGGLSGGDRVITDNLLKLHPGAAVAAAAPASATSAASAGAAP